jgi:hypothetical protein
VQITQVEWLYFMSSDNTLSSSELRTIIATLDRKVESAEVALLRSEDSYASALRDSALSGAPCNRSGYLGGIERKRTELAIEKDTLETATRLLAEAVARERAEAEEVTRTAVRGLLTELATTAGEADVALALYLERFQAAKRVERNASQIIRDGLGAEVFGFSLPYALSEAARHLESQRGGNPTDFEPWTAKWAEKATTELSRAAKV